MLICRLKQALKAGFRHLVFEDNYDTGTGDHYSFRQICDQFYIRGASSVIFTNYQSIYEQLMVLQCMFLEMHGTLIKVKEVIYTVNFTG